MEKLTIKIKKLQKSICNKIDCLNNGGCIQFAYYFSRKLTELNIPHTIFFANWRKIRLTKKDFYSVSHVMVYIEGLGYIDGYETFPSLANARYDNGSYYKHSKVSISKLNHFRNNYSWNEEYNKQQNSLLSRLIQKHIYV